MLSIIGARKGLGGRWFNIIMAIVVIITIILIFPVIRALLKAVKSAGKVSEDVGQTAEKASDLVTGISKAVIEGLNQGAISLGLKADPNEVIIESVKFPAESSCWNEYYYLSFYPGGLYNPDLNTSGSQVPPALYEVCRSIASEFIYDGQSLVAIVMGFDVDDCLARVRKAGSKVAWSIVCNAFQTELVELNKGWNFGEQTLGAWLSTGWISLYSSDMKKVIDAVEKLPNR